MQAPSRITRALFLNAMDLQAFKQLLGVSLLDPVFLG